MLIGEEIDRLEIFAFGRASAKKSSSRAASEPKVGLLILWLRHGLRLNLLGKVSSEIGKYKLIAT
ncbi:hypothetical protein BAU15_12840 [Enterococcus sp. JM4C]|nr:hypothetical protein BAU15_12840 [Enterococcus sp. JM4C]